eukprot:scaffold109171_cov75-Phaeocystis_antarctica.AAC.1
MWRQNTIESALRARLNPYLHQSTLEHFPFYQRCARALLRVELTVARSVHPPHHRGKHRAQQTGDAHALLVEMGRGRDG